jgi:hypothetical protein
VRESLGPEVLYLSFICIYLVMVNINVLFSIFIFIA